MKCDEKLLKADTPFEPESPYVIVCEGFHERSLVCKLLEHLQINNCDVTFPRTSGKSAVVDVVGLLAGRVEPLSGVFVIADADEDSADSFRTMQAAFVAPFPPPTNPFEIHQGRKYRTGIFLMPGRGRTGALEHLLLDAATIQSPDAIQCIDQFQNSIGSTGRMVGWSENKIGKMRFACYVATNCQNDPTCSAGFIWQRKNRILDIASPVFQELSDFLSACTQ